jgi:hypothetical protein
MLHLKNYWQKQKEILLRLQERRQELKTKKIKNSKKA